MNLSKTYECIPHQLLIAKLEFYGLGKASFRLMLDFLPRSKQRTKIGSTFSSLYHICTEKSYLQVSRSKEVKLLGITIDNKLKFKKHIEDLHLEDLHMTCTCHALRRLRTYLTVDKARLLANSVIYSQFNYAPLIWLLACKTAINKICKIITEHLK